jgi:hypothetical protein
MQHRIKNSLNEANTMSSNSQCHRQRKKASLRSTCKRCYLCEYKNTASHLATCLLHSVSKDLLQKSLPVQLRTLQPGTYRRRFSSSTLSTFAPLAGSLSKRESYERSHSSTANQSCSSASSNGYTSPLYQPVKPLDRAKSSSSGLLATRSQPIDSRTP